MKVEQGTSGVAAVQTRSSSLHRLRCCDDGMGVVQSLSDLSTYVMKIVYVLLLQLGLSQSLRNFLKMSTINALNKGIELSKLTRSKYFDQGRIDRVHSLPEFNLEFKQITSTKKSIKCYVLSDIHADAEKNQVWVRERCLRTTEDVHKDVFTVFIVPGDIGSEIDRIQSVLVNLVKNYDAVCYLPGNHEAWRKGTAAGGSALLVNDPNYKRPDNRMAPDSVAKLVEVVECARQCGVHVGPLRVVLASTERVQSSVGGSKERSAASVERPGANFDTVFSSVKLESTSTPSTSVNTESTEATQAEEAAETAVVVMPLYGWYHSSWDTEPAITDPQFLAAEKALPFPRKWGDYSMCTWPDQIISQEEFVTNPDFSTTLAETFAKLNEPFLYPPPYQQALGDRSAVNTGTSNGNTLSKSTVSDQSSTRMDTRSTVAADGKRSYFGSPIAKPTDTVISYSHYLPRLELCPEKRFLTEPMLSKVIGSDVLESQVRRLQPHLHLYGHTHIPLDLELEGIRYLQWPLGYFREASLQCAPIHSTGPLLVHDTSLGAGKTGIPQNLASESTAWSRHYRTNSRDSSSQAIVNDLAPWVRARLQAFS